MDISHIVQIGENEVAELKLAVELTGKRAVDEEQAKNAAELKVQVLEQKLRALQREIALKDAY